MAHFLSRTESTQHTSSGDTLLFRVVSPAFDDLLALLFVGSGLFVGALAL